MVDLELIALSISFILFLTGYLLKSKDTLNLFFKIGMWGSGIDLVLYILRIELFALPQIINGFDAMIYYSYFAILFYLLWLSFEDNPNSTPVNSIATVLLMMLIPVLLMYMIFVDEFFLVVALLLFSVVGALTTVFFTASHFTDINKRNILFIIGGITLTMGIVLYPVFLISMRLFYFSLIMFYTGWFILIINLIIFFRK